MTQVIDLAALAHRRLKARDQEIARLRAEIERLHSCLCAQETVSVYAEIRHLTELTNTLAHENANLRAVLVARAHENANLRAVLAAP